MKLVKSVRFDNELEVIIEFISLDSLNRALEFFDDLILKIKKIPQDPYIYRQRPNQKDTNLRELIYKGYTIPFYMEKGVSPRMGTFLKFD